MKIPPAICFRVTRNCNARCTFCLAPPDGSHPAEELLVTRVDRLVQYGVRRIQFCGGEPTIHPGFPPLLAYTSARGVKTTLCTNALAISGALLPLLRSTRTSVRVSLHGDRDYHDAIAGVGCFQRTTTNLRRLLDAGIEASVQTTVVAGNASVIDWATAFCLAQGVRRLGILPFIPRGRGEECRHTFNLTAQERHALRDLVEARRRSLSGRLDLRWLDFTAKRIPVVETDGRVVMEGATEGLDITLCRIG